MQTHEEQCTKLRETVAMLRVLVCKQSVRIADQERALDHLHAQVRDLAETNDSLRRRLEISRR